MTTQPNAQPRRGGRALAPTLDVLAVLIIGFLLFSRIWTDFLWFRSVETPQVFTIRWTNTILLFAVFFVLSVAVVLINLLVARRLDAGKRAKNKQQQTGLFVLVSIAVGVVSGLSAINQLDTFLGWRNKTDFGRPAPFFESLDASFFVFDIPWWRFVVQQVGWIFVFGLMAAAVYYFMRANSGSIKIDPIQLQRGQMPQMQLNNPFNAKAQSHLSALAGILFLVLSAWMVLHRLSFAFSDNDALFTGVGYTDHHSRIVATTIMAAVLLVIAIAFFVNIKLRRWLIPGAGIAVALVTALIAQMIVPGLIQSLRVNPSEPVMERPYIEKQIAETRFAYGIEDTEVVDYQAKTDVSAGQLRADAVALPGIRLMDPEVIAPTFEQLQQVRGYYSFPDVLDVDRYTIDSQETDAIVAVREIDRKGLPEQNQTWNNIHTVYTHGYALVGAYGNRRQASGEPEWITRDIPPVGELDQDQARVYFGEKTDTYSIVGAPEGTEPVELDTPGGNEESGGETYTTYNGKGGVPIGNLLTRAAYAARFGDINMLLSSRVNSESQILYDRTPAERVRQIAPWLNIDQDPYPAVVDGRVVWLLDGYTTSNTFPNSQRVDLRDATSDSSSSWSSTGVAREDVNYMRNSVKAVVDAYDGTVSLYAWDEEDPILQTWNKAYPGILKNKSEISDDMLNHLRYPQDMFKVQRQVLGRYHMTDPMAWYQQSDLWVIPNDPRAKDTKEPPYFLSIKWPGEEKAVFSQTAVFVPNERENLGAYMAVVADAADEDYGKIRVLRLSDTHQVPGPNQTYNAIQTDQRVQQALLPFTTQGAAEAVYGNLLTLPLGGGLIYVEPIYTRGKTQGAYPVLRFIAVRFGDHIGIGETLQESLDMVFEGDAGVDTGEKITPSEGNAGQTEQPKVGREASKAKLQEAASAYQAADKALRDGNLGEYQKQIGIARQRMEEADKALG
ncbi:UPF0182 family membrane protein [Propionimicrobium lymphophilum]|uniref:UPF0182 family membrane protein n=1 Tax=Propionimicrobium lymphophilum TaxID=33012 RepID=UPI00288BFED8|nr:UPF0182 family protein [Propionimicrobium lymphophilum]